MWQRINCFMGHIVHIAVSGACLIYLMLLANLTAWAQHSVTRSEQDTPKVAADKGKVLLSLTYVLQEMLKRNPALARERLTIQQAKADHIAAKGIFAFDLELDLKLNRSHLPVDIQVDSTLLGNYGDDLALQNLRIEGYILLSKRFSLGTVISMHFQNWWSLQDRLDFTSLLQQKPNPIIDTQNISATFTLRIDQPILRGAWRPVNLAPIWQAAEKVRMIEHQVAVVAGQYVLQTVHAYWDLVYAHSNLDIQSSALQVSQKQLNQTMALIKAGKIPPLEQYQVKQVEAARRGDWLLAREQVAIAETRLRILLHLQPDAYVGDANYSREQLALPDLTELISFAQREHPQIAVAISQQKIATLSVQTANNATLPQLNFTSSFTFVGFGSSSSKDPNAVSPFEGAYSTLFDPRSHRFYVGVNLQIPLDNRAAQQKLVSHQIELQRSQLQIELLQRQLDLQIRQLHAQAQHAQQRIAIAESSSIWAAKKLQAEQSKYQLGQSTLYQILQYQQDLATAQLAQLRAFIDYRKNLASLYHEAGKILTHYNVVASR